MELSKLVRDLRFAKGWGPDELANRAKISRTALYQIERGTTSRPQAATLSRISQALGIPPEALLETPPNPTEETPADTENHQEAMCSGRDHSSDRLDELMGKFRVLLASPLAEGVARIVEESFRLLPIIPPPTAAGEASGYGSAREFAPAHRSRPRFPSMV
jgi:transcriptional regulator with XRE-family HTH domain